MERGSSEKKDQGGAGNDPVLTHRLIGSHNKWVTIWIHYAKGMTMFLRSSRHLVAWKLPSAECRSLEKKALPVVDSALVWAQRCSVLVVGCGKRAPAGWVVHGGGFCCVWLGLVVLVRWLVAALVPTRWVVLVKMVVLGENEMKMCGRWGASPLLMFRFGRDWEKGIDWWAELWFYFSFSDFDFQIWVLKILGFGCCWGWRWREKIRNQYFISF